jgi:VanZ family protein
MEKYFSILPRWFPAFIMMLVIFTFSSQPVNKLPNFQNWDYLIKKTSHAVEYGLLAFSYLHLLQADKRKYWFAWLLAVGYAATDEYHQSFVYGRHASIYDVIIFDNLGALVLLWFHRVKFRKKKYPSDTK